MLQIFPPDTNADFFSELVPVVVEDIEHLSDFCHPEDSP